MSLHRLMRTTDPGSASLLDYNPFDILGLNPGDPDFPDNQALRAAYDRAAAHTHPFATSSTLTLLPFVQVMLAYRTLRGPLRTPARAFWRSHHRSTWNPHAPVGSVEAGMPIPGQSGPGPDEAAVLKAAAVAAVEANDHDYSLELLGAYIPPPGPQDALADRSDRGPDGDPGALCSVLLGTFRTGTEKDERANVVVAMLDHRGRYYRGILDFTMEREPLPEWKANDRCSGWESYFAVSCPPHSIDYLPRFRNRTESEVMALVRQELARLQDEDEEMEDAPPLTAGQAA
ncbi:MAG: hypothetical protein M1826_007089 [Phylliscum demangeonii]|nr:MAG: hypothetical protein M1826_007089 [Phylliscum demangeonii]